MNKETMCLKHLYNTKNYCAICLEEYGDKIRKQTLEEVLKWINDNWTEHRSFGFSIKEHLEQKLRELSK